MSSPKKIFHIVSKASWAAAQQAGEYRGDTLVSEGFIHCSLIHQVLFVANARYKGREDLVLLDINETQVTPEGKIRRRGSRRALPSHLRAVEP